MSSSNTNKRIRVSRELHECDICHRTFEKSKDLRNHKRTHQSESIDAQEESSETDDDSMDDMLCKI